MACFICFCGFVTRWAAASELIGPQDVITIDDWGIDVDSGLDSSPVDAVTVMPDFTVDIPGIVPFSAWNPGDVTYDVVLDFGNSAGELCIGESQNDYTVIKGVNNHNVSPQGTSANVYILSSRAFSSPYPDTAYVSFDGGSGTVYGIFTQDVNYSQADYDTLVISGDVLFDCLVGVRGSGSTVSFYSMSADWDVGLYINGNAYQDAVSSSDSLSWTVDLADTGSITSIGFRFSFGSVSRSVSYANAREVMAAFRYDDSGISIDANESTNGLLGSIIQFLQNILNGILSLPGNIASAIGNILQSLFVPSQDFLTMIRQEFEVLLSDRLGFLYQAGTMITDFATGIYDQLNSSYDMEFEFPGIGFESDLVDSGHIEILEPTTVSLDDNDFVTTIQPYLGTAVAFICVLAFVNAAHDMVVAVIGGRSYFDYLFRRGEGDA